MRPDNANPSVSGEMTEGPYSRRHRDRSGGSAHPAVSKPGSSGFPFAFIPRGRDQFLAAPARPAPLCGASDGSRRDVLALVA